MAVKGIGGRKETCLKHSDRPAVGRCVQCHTPVCSSCAIKKKEGIFCSEDCYEAHQQFASTYKGPAKLSKNYMHKIVQGVIYLAILIGLAEVMALLKFPFFINLVQRFPWH